MALSQEEIEKRIRDSYEIPSNVFESVPKPLVSIRTSTYQHASYIKDCIEGVLMQKTDFPFEYIIGEDFSSDGTREIVFEYAKKFPNIIRLITADYNVGSKANGRRCVRAARGHYMASCEGDDYWTDPFKLQKQITFLEDNKDYVMSHTDCDMLFVRKNELVPNANEDYSKIDISTKERLFSAIATGKIKIRTASVVFRKDVLKMFMGDKSFTMGDTPLWLNLSQHGKFHYLNESTVVYRIMRGSLSRPLKRVDHYGFILSGLLMRFFYYEKYGYSIPTYMLTNYKNYLENFYLLGGDETYLQDKYLTNDDKEKFNVIKCRNQNLNKFIYYISNPLIIASYLKNKIFDPL